MGLFLQTAVIPEASKSAVMEAVEHAAGQAGCELIPGRCQYADSEQGTQILFSDEAPKALAQVLSKFLQKPVLLLFICDGDHWGYDFYRDGQELDRFDTVPDYAGPLSEQMRQNRSGKPEVLAESFSILPDDIRNYLVFWDREDLDSADQLAYPGDRFPLGDCWQMTDFLTRLGWPWPFDEASWEPILPTLDEILCQNLPPVVDPLGPQASYDFQLDDIIAPSSMIFTTGDLPNALDPDYIYDLLQTDERDEFRALSEMTPQEVIEVQNQARLAIKYPSLYHIDPKLAAVSAFCQYWLGSAEGAFWDLYEALYNDPDNIFLHRARGLRVALGSKRHIAVKDMTALLELDPDNRDVYLLCRAFFCRINGKLPQSNADLEELSRMGFPPVLDTRIHYAGFPQSFLAVLDQTRCEGWPGISC